MIRDAANRAPNNTEIRFHLAVALQKAGQPEQARKELEQLLGTGKDFPQRQDAERLLNSLPKTGA